jgi:hypothetical protein
MREHILPLGESGFQARRGQCGSRNRAILNAKKAPPGRYCVRPPQGGNVGNPNTKSDVGTGFRF